MAKKKQILSISGFDSEHIRQTEQYAKMIDAIYTGAVDDYAKLATKLNINPDKPFSFSDYPTAKNKSEEIIKILSEKVKAVVKNGSENQWLFANQKNDAFLQSIFDTSKIKKTTLAKYQDRNLDALKTFQNRKINGMGLSDKIWDYSRQIKPSMEMGIDLAIGQGLPAKELAKQLQQYLVDPDKLFRRVRDKHGALQLSKKAAEFHTGQGKYRSSYKNALRLARTEINMSYREADSLRWKQLPFVSGFEVRLSNAHPAYDICDILKGKYPKDFQFVGWHPQCLCHAVPVLLSREEFNTDELAELKAAINGTEYKPFQSPNAVTDVPKGFTDWAKDNAERSKGWKSQPYFIRDNFKDGKISGGLDIGNVKPMPKTPEKTPVIPVPTKEPIKPKTSTIPEVFREGSDYMEGVKFAFKEDFFNLIDKDRPIALRFSKGGGSYARGGDLVQIEVGNRSTLSYSYKERIIYHEYGHAIDAQRGLRRSDEIKELMSRQRTLLSKKSLYKFRVEEYSASTRTIKSVVKEVPASKMAEVSNRLDNIFKKVRRMPQETFKKRGILRDDILENIGAVQDTIMSLNPNYGWGHTKAYYKNAGFREAEFIAHAFENTFAGNPIFKKYLPDLYEEMIKYIKTLK